MLTLNALGLENGLSHRLTPGRGDGFTYFGCKKSIKRLEKISANTHNLKFASINTAGGPGQQMGATGTSNEEAEYIHVRSSEVDVSAERDRE